MSVKFQKFSEVIENLSNKSNVANNHVKAAVLFALICDAVILSILLSVQFSWCSELFHFLLLEIDNDLKFSINYEHNIYIISEIM